MNQSGVTVSAGAATPVALSMPSGSIRANVSLGRDAACGTDGDGHGPGLVLRERAPRTPTGLYVFDNVPVGSGYTVSTTYGTTVQQSGQSVTKNGHTDVLLRFPPDRSRSPSRTSWAP